MCGGHWCIGGHSTKRGSIMTSIGVIGINNGGKKMFNGAADIFAGAASSPTVGRKI